MTLHVDYSLEDSVIGQLVVAADNGRMDLIREVVSMLDEKDFDRHRDAFKVIARLTTSGIAAGTMEMHQELGMGDKLFAVLEASEHVFTLVNTKIMARQLGSKRRRQELDAAHSKANATGKREDFAAAAKIAAELSGIGESRGNLNHTKAIAKGVFDRLEAAFSGDLPDYPKSGYPDIDECLGGLQPGAVTVVGARPGIGKTSFALNVIERACLGQGVESLVISCEMTKEELFSRLLSQLTRISTHRLRLGRITDGDWPKLAKATDQLTRAPLTIWDGSSPNLVDIEKAVAASGSPKIVVIDYLQLCTSMQPRQTRSLEVGEVSRGLKALAKERKAHFIVLSQLNRAGDGERPTLANLRESGDIEQDADAIMLLSKPGGPESDTNVLCDIAKNRHGPTELVTLRWLKQFTRFEPA